MSSILAIEDELRRGGLLFAWWLACLSDSMGAFFWRQRPLLCDDDYDNEPPVAWDGEHFQPVDDPDQVRCWLSCRNDFTSQRAHDADILACAVRALQYKCWYMSAHDLAKIAREACRRLWMPRVEKAGIPLASLQHLIDLLCAWRDTNLSMVAVPNQWPATWDFVHAVTACAADSNFHVCVSCSFLLSHLSATGTDVHRAPLLFLAACGSASTEVCSTTTFSKTTRSVPVERPPHPNLLRRSTRFVRSSARRPPTPPHESPPS